MDFKFNITNKRRKKVSFFKIKEKRIVFHDDNILHTHSNK